MTSLIAVLLCAVIAASCGGGPSPAGASPTGPSTAGIAAALGEAVPPKATPAPTASAAPVETFPPCVATEPCRMVNEAVAKIDAAKMNDHLLALTSVGSRDPRHPGHAKAVAYIKEQLGALSSYGWKIESHRTTYQGIPLENIFASLDGASAAWSGSIIQRLPPATSWVLVAAHYDSTADRTSGWRAASDPAPGADDNATGTAALLELARVVSVTAREHLRSRLVLAFFDGEELFFRGSAAYLQTLTKPYPISAVVNIDMVGWNPITDRLDLIWYGAQSDKLRDRVKATNAKYEIGVSQLVEVFANDGSQYILDSAPFGLAGIPAVTLAERYGDPDATFPGNTTFHTVNDTPDKITNKRLWLKAAKLALAVALELAMAERP